MMSIEGETSKGDQIAHRLFTKFALTIDDARNVHAEGLRDRDDKWDKWFNTEVPDTDVYKEQLKMFKSVSKLNESPLRLELRVFLSVPDLTNNQVLVHHPPNASRARVDPTPALILLESWQMSFFLSPSSGHSSRSSSYASSGSNSPVGPEVTLATVYKHAIATIRSMYTLLRVLPAWRLCKRPRRSRGGNLNLVLRMRVRGASPGMEGTDEDVMRILGFGTRLSAVSPPLQTDSYAFDNINHPMGYFSFGVTYLQLPHFELDTVEALESSRILSLNSGPDFTPTLARNAARDSMSASPGSLPMRTSLPRSPPSSIPSAGIVGPATAGVTGLGLGQPTNSVADRFVLSTNNASRTSFPSTSPRSRNVALPTAVQRSTSATQSGSPVGSVGSSSRLSREETASIASRARRESMGMRVSDVNSDGIPFRRPSVVQPFKSGPLSSASPSVYNSSPSARTGSPLTTGPSLPSRPPPSPTMGRGLTAFRSDPPVPSAPLSAGITAFRAGSSPVPPLRPSPPGGAGPSSLGDRRHFPAIVSSVETGGSGSSTERMAMTSGAPTVSSGADPVPVRRKRYSSSFGHRYANSGGANSDISAGSAEKGKGKEVDPVSNASYLSTNTDDDDISAFVQAIDSRRPIGPAPSHDRDRDRRQSEVEGLADRFVVDSTRSSPSFRGRTISEGPLGPRSSSLARHAVAMATVEQSEANPLSIDEKLRQLNDQYNASMNVMERRPGSREKGKGREGDASSDRGSDRRLPLVGPSSPLGRAPPSPSTERSSPLARQVGAEAMSRRAVTTAGGEYSIWTNREERPLSRRVRTDSAASGASGLSDIGRARLLYTQSQTARGSAGSIGSEEVVGKLELEK